MEFLTEVELTVPTGMIATELEILKRAEGERAAELAREGHLLRIWRPTKPGWHNIGLWRAASQADLELLLESLPLYPFMTTVRIQPLNPHPSDPSVMDQASRMDRASPVRNEFAMRKRSAMRIHEFVSVAPGRGVLTSAAVDEGELDVSELLPLLVATPESEHALFVETVRENLGGESALSYVYAAHPRAVETLSALLAQFVIDEPNAAFAAAWHRVGTLQAEDTLLVVAVVAQDRAAASVYCDSLVEIVKQHLPVGCL